MEHAKKEMTDSEKREATNERIRQTLGTSPEFRKKVDEFFSKPRIVTQIVPTLTSKQNVNTSEDENKKEQPKGSVVEENVEITSSGPKESNALDHILKMIKMKIRPM